MSSETKKSTRQRKGTLTYNQFQTKIGGLGLSMGRVGQEWTKYKNGNILDGDLTPINIKKLISTIKKERPKKERPKSPKKTVDPDTSMQSEVSHCIPYLHVNSKISDELLVNLVTEFVENHFHHLRKDLCENNSRRYYLEYKYHELLELKINVIYINNPIGKSILTYIMNGTDLYRDGSRKQIGNIKTEKYLFVRGEVADYYGIE